MIKYTDQYTLLKIAAFAMAVFCFTFPFVEYPLLVTDGPSWLGLDVSWQVTLNYAFNNDWVWGKDIVYTYGPLGFLATRIGLGISKWIFLLFDIFLIYNFFHLFKEYLYTAADKYVAIVTVFCITLLMNTKHGSDLSWVIMVFMYYWMYKSYQKPHYFYFVMVGINLLLCFYIKLNTGIVGIAFLMGHLTNLVVFKKISIIKALLVLSFTICVVILMAFMLHVSLPEYIKGAFEIIRGYNDVMYMYKGSFLRFELNVTTLFFAIVLLYAVYLVLIAEEKKYSVLFFPLISIAYIFLLRKQSVLRNDTLHYFEFFAYAPLVFLSSGLLIQHSKYAKYVGRYIMLAVLYSCFMIAEFDGKEVDNSIYSRYANMGNYFSEIASYDKKIYRNQAKKRFIPKRVLTEIGKNTIDVFPWDVEYILENKLNYSPRPVFQSFSAYTEKLQLINYNHYLTRAPMFIMYDYDAVDDRYPFNDDCLVNFFICKNYTFTDSFISNKRLRVLLRKKQKTEAVLFNQIKEEKLKLTDSIGIDWEQVSLLKIELEYNLRGRIESIFNRAPVIELKMRRLNGQSVIYRTSLEMLRAGIMVDRWVNDTKDFVKYLSDKNTLDVIQSVKLVTKPVYFNGNMNIKYIVVK